MLSPAPAVQVVQVIHRTSGKEVLRIDNLSIQAGTIIGLIGSNGSGKTTLLSMMANLVKPSKGWVLVDGEILYENPEVVSKVCLVGLNYSDKNKLLGDYTVEGVLDLLWRNWPKWHKTYSNELIVKFNLPRQQKINLLSVGERAKLEAVIGLSSGAELVLFDEVTNGMDGASREKFYAEIQKQCTSWEERMDEGNPAFSNRRTFILSTHLLSPGELIFDQLIMLESGSVAFHEDKSRFEDLAYEVSGPDRELDEVRQYSGLLVLDDREIEGGRRKLLIISPEGKPTQRGKQVEIRHVSCEDLAHYLMDRPGLWKHVIRPFLSASSDVRETDNLFD